MYAENAVKLQLTNPETKNTLIIVENNRAGICDS